MQQCQRLLAVTDRISARRRAIARRRLQVIRPASVPATCAVRLMALLNRGVYCLGQFAVVGVNGLATRLCLHHTLLDAAER